MNYSELCSKFCFELPAYAEQYFDGFIAQYNRNTPILTLEKIDAVWEATSLPEEAKETLLKYTEILHASDDGHLCGSFLAYLVVYQREPWLNYIYRDEHFVVDGLTAQQLGWIFVVLQLAETLLVRKTPADLNAENINTFVGYTNNCKNQHGYWGIVEWWWNMISAGGCMFMFGILKFSPHEFGGDFAVITDGEKFVSLAVIDAFIDKNGCFVDSEEKAVAKASFYEDEEKYVAHVVAPNGVVDKEPTVFDKKVWRDFLRHGTPTLDIHIPAKVVYTSETIKDAYKQAVEYYSKNWGFDAKAITAYSWLYCPQLDKVLPPESNILAVNAGMHLLPMIETFDANCTFIRPGSSLQKRFAEECEKGTEFHFGMMYTTTPEIETFGKKLM